MTIGTWLGTGERRHSRWRGLDGSILGGVCAVLGGLCWVGKSSAILATGVQPGILFELAPLLMAVSVVVLARQLIPSPARTRAELLAAAAGVAAAVVAANEAVRLPEVVAGTAMAAANLLTLAVLIVAGIQIKRRIEGVAGWLPLMLGLLTVPAILMGGALAAVLGERALEVPILALGLIWTVFGVCLATRCYRIDIAQMDAAGYGVTVAVSRGRATSVREGQQRRKRIISGTCFIIAGSLWTLHAVVLNSRPEGCIASQCTLSGSSARPTEDLLWLFLLSVSSLGVAMLTATTDEGAQGRAARLTATGLVLAGVAALGLGLVINASLTGDSPLWWLHDSDSLGRLLPMFGTLAAGIAAIRGNWLRRWHGALLVASFIVSLGFNAQNDRILFTVPLGLMWTAIGLHEI